MNEETAKRLSHVKAGIDKVDAAAEALASSTCSPERVEALKRAVSTVLMDALNGRNPDYRLPKEEGGFIRWGRVEAAIHATIETSLANVQSGGTR